MTRNAKANKRLSEVLNTQCFARDLRKDGLTVSEIKIVLKDSGYKVSYLYPKRIKW